MAAVVSGRILGVVLALAVGGVPLAPPAHVHGADDHGHEHLLVHRHFDAHSSEHHADHVSVVDDDDAPILTLDAVHAVPTSAALLIAPTGVLVADAEPPVVPIAARSVDVERLIHGPPRAPNGLRAPPLSSRL